MRSTTTGLLGLFTTVFGIACSAPVPPGAGGAGGTAGSAGSGAGPSTGPDGCGTSPARNLNIREVAAYQTLKIPIATAQRVFEPGTRVADVIEGRNTMFRVFVDPQAGFSARTLSARVHVTSAGVTQQFYQRRLVSGASFEADLGSTFVINVPADRIRSDARYAVEVVECGPASGGTGVYRVPAVGDAALGARRIGPLKVRIVPIVTNSRQPDLSPAALGLYRELLRAMYPVSGVEFSVTSAINTFYPVNFATMLDQVRAKRQSEAPPADVYYHGLVKPNDTFSEYCRFSCTTGMAFIMSATNSALRAGVSIGFGDNTSAYTIAHELGHNHGRQHAPCGGAAGPDPNYPYAGARLGTWGYDPRRNVLLDPARGTDVMSYCSNQWVSDYTYRALTTRAAAVNSAFNVVEDPALVARWQVLLLEPPSARWGLPFEQPAAAFGEPEPADILDASGSVLERVTVYRTEASDDKSFTVLVPPARSGWHAVRVNGAEPLSFSAPITVPAP